MFRYDFGVLYSKLCAYEALGLSKPTIIKLVTHYPSLLVGGVSANFHKVLGKLKSLGRGDQLKERLVVLVNAGLDCNTISQMIKAVPTILNQSIDTIEKKIDFLLNHMGYSIESLLDFPAFLCYNIDKIQLRFTMYAWLKERKVIAPGRNRKIVRSNVALSTILTYSDTSIAYPSPVSILTNIRCSFGTNVLRSGIVISNGQFLMPTHPMSMIATSLNYRSSDTTPDQLQANEIGLQVEMYVPNHEEHEEDLHVPAELIMKTKVKQVQHVVQALTSRILEGQAMELQSMSCRMINFKQVDPKMGQLAAEDWNIMMQHVPTQKPY
ncbi:hypothetical protein ZIOFF_073003 [Zingiber officinale]|uniref:Uncharacterized protein n=1 Tax=Zingiber officinale TaxID=94328 RepID=A0A8J5ETK9_ZINOF|nr:hypothetical protein ZIOFF_073003 [Zingiber officinale]